MKINSNFLKTYFLVILIVILTCIDRRAGYEQIGAAGQAS